MNKLIFLFVALLSVNTAIGQLTKGSWLVGGSGAFNSNDHSNDYGTPSYKETIAQLQPNIGYFFIDRLAGGLKLSMSLRRTKMAEEFYNLQKNNSYGFGPFVRYYILNGESRFNFLVEGSYQYQIERGGHVRSDNSEPRPVRMGQYTKNVFGVAGGPVIYFNRSIGLELLAGYNFTGYTGNKNSELWFGIGLQIHLEKE